MGIIVSTAAIAVLLVLALDAFGVLPEQVEEVVEPEPVEAPIEGTVEPPAEQQPILDSYKYPDEPEDKWVNSGSASYTIDT